MWWRIWLTVGLMGLMLRAQDGSLDKRLDELLSQSEAWDMNIFTKDEVDQCYDYWGRPYSKRTIRCFYFHYSKFKADRTVKLQHVIANQDFDEIFKYTNSVGLYAPDVSAAYSKCLMDDCPFKTVAYFRTGEYIDYFSFMCCLPSSYFNPPLTLEQAFFYPQNLYGYASVSDQAPVQSFNITKCFTDGKTYSLRTFKSLRQCADVCVNIEFGANDECEKTADLAGVTLGECPERMRTTDTDGEDQCFTRCNVQSAYGEDYAALQPMDLLILEALNTSAELKRSGCIAFFEPQQNGSCVVVFDVVSRQFRSPNMSRNGEYEAVGIGVNATGSTGVLRFSQEFLNFSHSDVNFTYIYHCKLGWSKANMDPLNPLVVCRCFQPEASLSNFQTCDSHLYADKPLTYTILSGTSEPNSDYKVLEKLIPSCADSIPPDQQNYTVFLCSRTFTMNGNEVQHKDLAVTLIGLTSGELNVYEFHDANFIRPVCAERRDAEDYTRIVSIACICLVNYTRTGAPSCIEGHDYTEQEDLLRRGSLPSANDTVSYVESMQERCQPTAEDEDERQLLSVTPNYLCYFLTRVIANKEEISRRGYYVRDSSVKGNPIVRSLCENSTVSAEFAVEGCNCAKYWDQDAVYFKTVCCCLPHAFASALALFTATN